MKKIKTKLRKELRNRKITIQEAARAIGIQRETLQRKISGKQPFYLHEAIVLHRLYFPELDFLEVFLEYEKEQGISTPCSVGRVI